MAAGTNASASTVTEMPALAGSPITWGWVGGGRWGVDLPADRILSEMASIGLRATESGVPGFLPEDDAAARRLVESHGLSVVAVPTSFVVHEPGTLDAAIERARVAARRARALGAEVVITVPKPGSHRPGDELAADSWRALLSGLDEIERACADEGARQALHPHVGSLVETAADMRRVLEGSAAGWCLDTAHLASGRMAAVDFVALAGDRIAHVHVKDLDRELGEAMVDHRIGFDEAIAAGVFRALGDGDLPLADTIAVLPCDVVWVLEQDRTVPSEPPRGEGPVVDAARSHALLTRLLGAG